MLKKYQSNAWIVLGLLLCNPLLASDGERDKASLLEIDRQIDQAMLSADAHALEPLLSETLVHVHVGGALIDTKQSELKSVPVLKDFYRSYHKDQISVQVYGTTGVLSAFIEAEQNTDLNPSVPPKVRYHQVRVYAQEHQHWKLAYQHTTWAVNSQDQTNDVANYLYSKGYVQSLK